MALTDEETNLRLMEGVDNYADWQFEIVSPNIRGAVLEIGGGVGTLTQRILRHPETTSCTATEINAENLKVLRKRFGSVARISDCNLEATVPADFAAQFDTVISINVMEHVKDDSAFFRNCCGCLRKGGRLVIIVPALSCLFGTLDDADRHFRRYEKTGLEALAIQNGMKLLRLSFMNAAGAFGWFYHGRILRAKVHAKGDLRAFNALVPALKKIESIVPVPFGLSLILVAERPRQPIHR